MQIARLRIIARPAQPGIEAQPAGLANDVGLGHVLERGADRDSTPLYTRLCGKIRHRLKCGDELRPTVGITRIVERVDSDVDGVGTGHFGEAKREREKDRVPGGNIGDGDAGLHPVLGHRDVRREGRSPDRGQIERDDDMALDTQMTPDIARAVEFDAVPLPIIDAECNQPVPRFARQPSGDERIKPARQEDNGRGWGGGGYGANPKQGTSGERTNGRSGQACSSVHCSGC